MASEQMHRKENETVETEIHSEEQRVPKMTTHSDVTCGDKNTPKEDKRKQHAEKARGSKELGTHFEPIANKVKAEREAHQKEKNRESYSDDRARTQNTVQHKEGEAKREREGGGVSDAAKFEVRAEAKGSEEEARRSRDRAETGGKTTGGVTAVITCKLEGNDEKGRGREEGEKEEREENESSYLEEISKYRAQAQQNAMDAISAAQERYQRAKQAAGETLSGTTQSAQEKSVQAKNIAMEKASQARNMAAQAKDVTIEKGQQGYVAAKDMASQAKDMTAEKGQQGYVATKDTISSAAKGAVDMASQAKDVTIEKGQQGYVAAKDMAAKAKDVTAEKGQQGYVAAKDTISSAAKSAVDYTAPVAEKAKDYTAQAAEKARDASVETGKSAARVAADLKDKATVAGWGAAQFSADKTVEGTKAAANAVQGAAGYAGQKASELAAKSVDTVKGLAAAAGETAKEYTARKKEEAEREYEAKKAAQPQETKERTSEKTTTESFQRGQGQRQEQGGGKLRPGAVGHTAEHVQQGQGQRQEQGGGKFRPGAVGHTAEHVPHKTSKPNETNNTMGSFQGFQETGRERNQVGVGETTSPYEQKIKPDEESFNQSGQNVKGGNVSTTTGHNVNSASQRVQKPNENILGRNCQGKQGEAGQTGEAKANIDKNVGNAAQREHHHSSDNITGFQGSKQEVNGRKREDGAGKSSGQVQGQQGRKGTEAMTLTTVGDGITTEGNSAQRKQLENTSGIDFQGGKEVVQGKGSEGVTTSIGETLGDVANRVKKPLDNVTAGGSKVLGAVGETVVEIGENMIKPAQKVQEQGQEGKGGGGVLNAIGETISEIAETTKVLVVGDGEAESKQSIGSDSSTPRV